MKKNYEEVKTSIYAGMSIFDMLKNCQIEIEGKNITIEDKKFLALYLGIINTENEISKFMKIKKLNFDIKVSFNFLKTEKYLEIYNNYFMEILNDVNFESIEDYFYSLLDKDIIKSFNKNNNYYLNHAKNKNKKLVK